VNATTVKTAMTIGTLQYLHRSLQASLIGWLMTLALLVVLVRDDAEEVNRQVRKTVLIVLAASQLARILDDVANPYDATSFSSPTFRAAFATAASGWLAPLALLTATHAMHASSGTLALCAALVAFGVTLALFRLHRRLVPSDYVDDDDRAPPFAGFSAFGTLVSAPFVAALNTLLYAMYLHYPLVGPRCALSLPADQCSAATVFFARASMPPPGASALPLLDTVAASLCDSAELYGNAVLRSALLVLATLLVWYKVALAQAVMRLLMPSAIERLLCRTMTLLSFGWILVHSIASAPLLIAVFGAIARSIVAPYAPGVAGMFSAIVPMRVAIDLQDALMPSVAWAHGHDSVDELLAALTRSACTMFAFKESIRF